MADYCQCLQWRVILNMCRRNYISSPLFLPILHSLALALLMKSHKKTYHTTPRRTVYFYHYEWLMRTVGRYCVAVQRFLNFVFKNGNFVARDVKQTPMYKRRWHSDLNQIRIPLLGDDEDCRWVLYCSGQFRCNGAWNKAAGKIRYSSSSSATKNLSQICLSKIGGLA